MLLALLEIYNLFCYKEAPLHLCLTSLLSLLQQYCSEEEGLKWCSEVKNG